MSASPPPSRRVLLTAAVATPRPPGSPGSSPRTCGAGHHRPVRGRQGRGRFHGRGTGPGGSGPGSARRWFRGTVPPGTPGGGAGHQRVRPLPSGRQDARLSPDWLVTSGSLFAHWALGWTGVPDGEAPGPDSGLHTGSAVFRLVSRRQDLGDTTVRSWVFLKPPGATARTPARAWDGGHLWLRHNNAQELYALSFRRRDGMVVLKRKHPAPGRPVDEEGVYTTLATAHHPLDYGRWHRISATVSTRDDDRVRIALALDGRTVLDAEDREPGRLTKPGGVGLRGDNTEMAFSGFTARGDAGHRRPDEVDGIEACVRSMAASDCPGVRIIVGGRTTVCPSAPGCSPARAPIPAARGTPAPPTGRRPRPTGTATRSAIG